MTNEVPDINAVSRKKRMIGWLKKVGFWGFIFFLAKGLVWLALFYFFARK
jgi:hypothetical protein